MFARMIAVQSEVPCTGAFKMIISCVYDYYEGCALLRTRLFGDDHVDRY